MILEEHLVMSAALLLFPVTREERLALNLRKTVREILAGNSPATMEVPDLSLGDIEAAWEGLKRFDIETPRYVQKRWGVMVPRDPKYREQDDGAIRKKPPSDWKLFFHYRPDLEGVLLEERSITLAEWERTWFMRMERIWQVCTAAHVSYATELDLLQPGFNFARRAELSKHLNCLRLLRYVPHKGDLAKPHTDRSATTFHVAENLPGFRTRHGFNVELQQSPTAPDVLVFTGDQLEEITRGGVPRRWHEVVDATDGTEERFAMVFFGKMFTGKL